MALAKPGHRGCCASLIDEHPEHPMRSQLAVPEAIPWLGLYAVRLLVEAHQVDHKRHRRSKLAGRLMARLSALNKRNPSFLDPDRMDNLLKAHK